MDYRIKDPAYVDGAIELVIDGVAIFDKSMWDLVDQLWIYNATSLRKLQSSGRAKMSFPDQPLEFSFERMKHGVLRVTSWPGSEPRVAFVAESEFVSVMKSEGSQFFEIMNRLNPSQQMMYSYSIQDLNAL